MLKPSDVRDIILPIMRSRLTAFGFEDASIRLGDDHDGDPSIFVELAFKEGHTPLPRGLSSTVGIECQDALAAAGEFRFAYLGFNVKTSLPLESFPA